MTAGNARAFVCGYFWHSEKILPVDWEYVTLTGFIPHKKQPTGSSGHFATLGASSGSAARKPARFAINV
jgi:hypothetical protein